jgi:hypothetical protein
LGRLVVVRDDIAVWILAVLIILLLSSVILYVEPSFPIAVMGAYIIEVIMYANLFINHKRFQESSPSKNNEYGEIFQLEKDD